MIVVNFSHPLTASQCAQIEALADKPVERVVVVPVQFDTVEPFGPQVQALVAAVGLSTVEWQTTPVLLVLPSLNFIAAALLAKLHGLMGYFPPIVRLRPVAGSMPPEFEVAELIDLQAIRDRARARRAGE